MAEIVVVTVQYRNFDDTARLAASLDRLARSRDIELLVVNNAADAKGTKQLADLSRSVGFPLRILSPGSNLYYWGGAALALDNLASERPAMPRWVMVCNNDITLPDKEFLTHLLALDPSAYPVVAPEITSTATGRHQNPLLETAPRMAQRLKWRIYDLHYGLAQLMLRTHRAIGRLNPRSATASRSSVDRERTIYAPHGACVLFSSSFFARGGRLDTAVPLFAEELTLAADAKRLGLAIHYVPALRIEHREHSTTGAALTRQKYEMERAARRRFYSMTGMP